MSQVDRPSIAFLLLGGALSVVVSLAASQPLGLWLLLSVFLVGAALLFSWKHLAASATARYLVVAALALGTIFVLSVILFAKRSRPVSGPTYWGDEAKNGTFVTAMREVLDDLGRPDSTASQPPAVAASAPPPAMVAFEPRPPAPSPDPSDVERRPIPSSALTVHEGQSVFLPDLDTTISVGFTTDRLGTIATLQVTTAGEKPIVEALLGPVGQIHFPFHGKRGTISIVAWDPQRKTVTLAIAR